jgi:hypothetical protein
MLPGTIRHTVAKLCRIRKIQYCFWAPTNEKLEGVGAQYKDWGDMENKTIQYKLYQQFVNQQFLYLCGEDFAPLPCIAIPICVENFIKDTFPNSKGVPYV